MRFGGNSIFASQPLDAIVNHNILFVTQNFNKLSKICFAKRFGSFVESPRRRSLTDLFAQIAKTWQAQFKSLNFKRNLQYLKHGGDVFLKSHIFALVAAVFHKRSKDFYDALRHKK